MADLNQRAQKANAAAPVTDKQLDAAAILGATSFVNLSRLVLSSAAKTYTSLGMNVAITATPINLKGVDDCVELLVANVRENKGKVVCPDNLDRKLSTALSNFKHTAGAELPFTRELIAHPSNNLKLLFLKLLLKFSDEQMKTRQPW